MDSHLVLAKEPRSMRECMLVGLSRLGAARGSKLDIVGMHYNSDAREPEGGEKLFWRF